MSLGDACRTRTLLADGAMGTELQRAGLEPGDCGELWTLRHPERVEAIHRAYLGAGSDLVVTNSFGANRWRLAAHDLADRVATINQRAAAIARRAAGGDRLVLGDIGPFGGFLAPLGDVTATELEQAFADQAAALLDGGADAVVIETMSALDEAVAAVRGALAAGAPAVVASMTFDRQPSGPPRTIMGVRVEAAGRALAAAGATVVGANCGTDLAIADFAGIVRLLRGACDCPVMIQPNAGRPELEDARIVYRLGPDEFAGGMRAVIDAGAAIVGGCCGTTPAHIAALARVLAEATS